MYFLLRRQGKESIEMFFRINMTYGSVIKITHEILCLLIVLDEISNGDSEFSNGHLRFLNFFFIYSFICFYDI